MTPDDLAWCRSQLLERFLRYVRIDTTSDRKNSETIPTTDGQWLLARILLEELQEAGIEDVELTDECFVIARIPASDDLRPARRPVTIGFMSHLDTSEDVTGRGVAPQIHEHWDGSPIRLGKERWLDPAEYPDLLRYRGETIITASGETLLGADDKAGIAEIVTAAAWLVAHPEVSHGPLELIFSPDEETGLGIRRLPRARIRCRYCYTIDGGEEGTIEGECFNAFAVEMRLFGHLIHPGTARGTMINPITMAANLLSSLPQSESPEATDGRYGFYCPLEMEGNFKQARLLFYIRDFEIAEVERRIEVLRRLGATIEAIYPGSRVEVEARQQYLNMLPALQEPPELLSYAQEAIRATGIEPKMQNIRGGTDGAQLTEMGIPSPNIFTGAHNVHGCHEWIALPAMLRAVRVIVNVAHLWSQS